MNWKEEKNRIYVESPDGNLIAEVTFPEITDGICAIDRTFVDESLRGQGVAGQLLRAAVLKLQKEGCRIRPVCSYAVHWFENHEEFHSLLENA